MHRRAWSAGEAAVAGAEGGGGAEEQRAGHRDGRALLHGGCAAGARPHRRLGRHRLAHQFPGRLPAAQRPRRRRCGGRSCRRACPGTGRTQHNQVPAFNRCVAIPLTCDIPHCERSYQACHPSVRRRQDPAQSSPSLQQVWPYPSSCGNYHMWNIRHSI